MSEDRIIKYFQKQVTYTDKEGKNIGLIVDFETDGLHEGKRPIELCLLPFTFTDDLDICKVFKPYVGLEEPLNPLSQEIREVTGLTDEMLKDQNFDDGAILGLIQKAEVLIAHHAEFDARVMKDRFPMMKKAPWACSMKDVPWKDVHIAARNLDYIAFRQGWWFEHHRAENDCRATLHMLSHPFRENGDTVFKVMMESAFTPRIKLVAKNTPFAKKDILKSRGYFWDGTVKAWCTEVTEDKLAEESKFLIGEVFFDVEIEEKPINLATRFLK